MTLDHHWPPPCSAPRITVSSTWQVQGWGSLTHPVVSLSPWMCFFLTRMTRTHGHIWYHIWTYIWVNYHISLTWIVRPFGDDFPNINHDSRARENSEVVIIYPDISHISIYIYIHIYIYIWYHIWTHMNIYIYIYNIYIYIEHRPLSPLSLSAPDTTDLDHPSSCGRASRAWWAKSKISTAPGPKSMDWFQNVTRKFGPKS